MIKDNFLVLAHSRKEDLHRDKIAWTSLALETNHFFGKLDRSNVSNLIRTVYREYFSGFRFTQDQNFIEKEQLLLEDMSIPSNVWDEYWRNVDYNLERFVTNMIEGGRPSEQFRETKIDKRRKERKFTEEDIFMNSMDLGLISWHKVQENYDTCLLLDEGKEFQQGLVPF